MKITIYNIFLLLGIAFFVTSCNKELEDGPTGGDVQFLFGGAADLTSEGELSPKESEIDTRTAYALIYVSGLLDSVVKVNPDEKGGSFKVGKECICDIEFLIDPEGAVAGALNSAIGTDRKSLDNIKYSIESGNHAVMISKETFSVNISADKPASIGKVDFVRPVARIDIMNAVDNLTITKIEARNCIVEDGLYGESEGKYGDFVYENLDLKGSSQNPVTSQESMYSFRNSSYEEKINVTITYMLYGEEKTVNTEFSKGVEANRRYVVSLLPPDSEAAPASVRTWENADAVIFRIEEEEPYTPVENQDELNAALAINNFCTDVVKNISDDKVVEFFESNVLDDDAQSYFAWQPNWEKKIYIDAAENSYRVPDYDEMSLLLPKTYRILRFDEPSSTQDLEEDLPATLFDGLYQGGVGTSDFTSVKNEVASMPNHIVYAIRFKNTPQVSAYRYEWKNYGNENADAYLEIKIKGIDPSDMPDLKYISNEVFWEDDYLVYKMPAGGYKKSGNIICKGTYGYFWTRTEEDETTAMAANFFSATTDIYKHSKDNGLLLMLVKTTQAPEDEVSQQELNERLALSRFGKYVVMSMDEANSTVEQMTHLPSETDITEENVPIFSWNAEWETKEYTENGMTYRVPTKDEMLLLIPADNNYVYLEGVNLVKNNYTETLPDMLFSDVKNGGVGVSEFESVQEGDSFVTYAIRFKGTEQRAAYQYRLIEDSGKYTYVSIKVKAIADDFVQLSDVSNQDYWESDYIETFFPFLGKTAFNGSVSGLGENGHYWLSTCESSADAYCAIIAPSSFYLYSALSSAKNKRALKMIRVD